MVKNQKGGDSCGAHHTTLQHGQGGGGSCGLAPSNIEQSGGYSSFYEPAVVEQIYGGAGRRRERRSTRRSARRSTRRSARRSMRR